MNERGDVVVRVALARPYRSVLVRDGVTTALDGQAVDIDEAGRVLLRSVGGTAETPRPTRSSSGTRAGSRRWPSRPPSAAT